MHLRFFLDPSITEWKFESPKEGDAGFDLRSAESVSLQKNGHYTISTLLYLEIPLGWVGIIKDRSSMALKRVHTHGGVIDSSYRGEIKIILSYQGEETYTINKGDKIAQLVVVPYLSECIEVSSFDALGITQRGSLGFGSSGR